jgi:hypothetical protein
MERFSPAFTVTFFPGFSTAPLADAGHILDRDVFGNAQCMPTYQGLRYLMDAIFAAVS